MNEDKSKKAVEELQKGIEKFVYNIISSLPFDKTLTGVITASGTDGYTININGTLYTEIPKLSTITLAVKDVVKIKVPQNNMNNMYIEGKLG